MFGDFNDIIILFQTIKSLEKLGDNYCIVFVYNSPRTMKDTFHATECIFPEELHMIISAFKKIAVHVLLLRLLAV